MLLACNNTLHILWKTMKAIICGRYCSLSLSGSLNQLHKSQRMQFPFKQSWTINQFDQLIKLSVYDDLIFGLHSLGFHCSEWYQLSLDIPSCFTACIYLDFEFRSNPRRDWIQFLKIFPVSCNFFLEKIRTFFLLKSEIGFGMKKKSNLEMFFLSYIVQPYFYTSWKRTGFLFPILECGSSGCVCWQWEMVFLS